MLQVKINRNGQSTYISGAVAPKGALAIEFLDFPSVLNAEFRYVAQFQPLEGEGITLPAQTLTADKPAVTIENTDLTAGVLKSRIVCIVGGREYRRYNIEDLVITECEDEFTAQPRMEKAEADIAALTTKLQSLTTAIEGLSTALTEHKAELVALAKFAYEDYKSNVYLDGTDSAEEFLAKYGLKLVTIKDLKGE